MATVPVGVLKRLHRLGIKLLVLPLNCTAVSRRLHPAEGCSMVGWQTLAANDAQRTAILAG